MTFIANHTALTMLAANQAVLIDVREPAEYREGHLAGARNLPSTKFQIEDYLEFDDRAICLICQTGNRATHIAADLKQHGIENVFLLETQMAHLQEGRHEAQVSAYAE